MAHATDLPTSAYPAGTRIVFTFYWPADDRWEHADYGVVVAAAQDG